VQFIQNKRRRRTLLTTSRRLFIKFGLAIIIFYNVILQIKNRSNDEDRVSLYVPYDPNICKGTLSIMAPNQPSTDGIALVVREAALDTRFVSIRDARKLYPNQEFLRLQLLLSLIPDAKKDNRTYILQVERSLQQHATIQYSDGRSADKIDVKFDYLIEDGRCQRTCIRYKTCRVREWQAIVTVLSTDMGEKENLEDYMQDLIDEGAFLRLNLPVVIQESGLIETVIVDIGLSCTAGLSKTNRLPYVDRTIPGEQGDCNNARGALTIGGGALFGEMRYNESAWRSIAHYGARHLLGHTWYDTVAVALLAEFTVSEIIQICSFSEKVSDCVNHYHSKNMDYFNKVRRVVEEELYELNVPRKKWTRLILFQFCGLGSDFEGTEKGMPCAASFHNGQKILGLIGYTHFSRGHSWASNFDLDELLVDETAPSISSGNYPHEYESAHDRFTSLRRETNKTSYYTEWMDFSVDSSDTRKFTTDIMNGQRVGFKSRDALDKNLNFTECYGGGGKVISHCSVTAGLLVHYALIAEKETNLSRIHCGPVRTPRRRKLFRTSPNETELYTWHPRKIPRQGLCAYSSGPPVQKEGCLVRPRSSIYCSSAISKVNKKP